MVAEFTRLANWPMITLGQSDLANTFTTRQTRDACAYAMTYTRTNGQITAVTVTCANQNICDVPIPLTIPLGSSVVSTMGMQTEQIGSDPLTIWVNMNGSPMTFQFTSGVAAGS
jgi:hypothetical protein